MNVAPALVGRFLEPDDPAWTAALRTMRHDIYHLPEYVRFAARRQVQGQPTAFYAEEAGGRILVPLIVRAVPERLGSALSDATSSRLFPGVLIAAERGTDAERFAGRALDAFIHGLRARGIVTAFIRLHPLLMPPLSVLRARGIVVDHGETVSLDLTLPEEELWQQMRQNHRRDVIRARRLGYCARIDERWERLDDFVDIYRQSMERLGAGDAWRLDRDVFRDLREALANRVHLGVVELGHRLVAGALLTETDGMVEYHLAGTADADVHASPSKLLIDFARRWARARGNRLFHLAGSQRRSDGLNHFKLGFSARVHPMLSWRLVVDEAAYRDLVERWEERVHATPQPVDGFFPAYREGIRGRMTAAALSDHAVMTSDRWEHGSDFPLAVETGHTEFPWTGHPHSLWRSGRDALEAIVAWSRTRHGSRRLYMPSYFCHARTFRATALIEGRIYPSAPTSPTGGPHDVGSRDMVLIPAFFGMRPASRPPGPVLVVEDHTHDLIAPWAFDSGPDYAFASLRKTLPLPDGGIVWSPRGLPVPPERSTTEAHDQGVLCRLDAMSLKLRYLAGGDVDKARFQSLMEESEHELQIGSRPGSRGSHASDSTRCPSSRGAGREPATSGPFARPSARSTASRSSTRRSRLPWCSRHRTSGSRPRSAHGREDLPGRAVAAGRKGPARRPAGAHRPFATDAVAPLRPALRRRGHGPRGGRGPAGGDAVTTARLLSVDDPAWGAFLDASVHDFYHLPAYVALVAEQERATPCALLVERGAAKMLLPLCVRPIAGGGQDATSPYGYPGPLVHGTEDPSFLDEAFAEGVRCLAADGIVSLFVRLHPLLNPRSPSRIGEIVEHGETVAIDLTCPPEELWRQTRSDHRREINRSARAGHQVTVVNDQVHLDVFKRLYRETMARRSADSYYFFGDGYFDRLADALGDRLNIGMLTIGGEVAAMELLVETCGIVEGHLAASDARYAEHAPGKALVHNVRAWAASRGDRWLHLGGGVGAASDSLFAFKAGFSRLRFPFRTLRVILIEKEYLRLVAARDARRDPARSDGFFPWYRAGERGGR